MILTPVSTTNRPGLSALQYRVGTFSAFYETMLTRLSSEDFPALAGLAARTPDDPAIALLDGWSALLDVLTFYQERVANEGYLRTAVERKSVLELARLTGYTLNPGVSASVYLAYTLDKGKSVTIPAGSRAQSMAAQGTLPESFETSADLDAADTYNSLGIRKTQPSLLADDTTAIYIDGTANNLKPNDALLLVSETGSIVRRVAAVELQSAQSQTKLTLQPLPTAAPPQGATPQPMESAAPTAGAAPAGAAGTSGVTPGLYARSTSSGPGSGLPSVGGIVLPAAPSIFSQLRNLVTPLTKLPAAHPPNPRELVRSVASSFSAQSANTPALLKTLYPSLEPQLDSAFRNAVVAALLQTGAYIFRVKAGPFGSNASLQYVAPSTKTGGPGTYQEWSLQRTVAGASEAFRLDATIVPQVSTGAATVGFTVTLGQTTFTQPAEPVGLNAPMTVNIPAASETVVVSIARSNDVQGTEVVTFTFQKSGATVILGQGIAATGIQLTSTSVTTNDNVYHFLLAGSLPSTGTSQTTETAGVLWLDAAYDQIQPNTWVALDGAKSLVATVTAAATASRADYGLVGRATRLTLDKDWIDPSKDTFTDLRNTTVYAQAESLTLREETIATTVSGNRLELDDLYTGLDAGRWIIVQGERADLPGVMATELMMLAGVDEDVQRTSDAPAAPPLPGEQVHSFLNLTNSLSYEYTRDSFTITANVVKATHGQSCSEVIGSGDSSQAFQSFVLHQSPLTYVSAPTVSGSQSTLDLSVNNVLWSEATQLLEMGPTDRKYLIRTDDSGTSTVVFGDGTNGLRPPTGTENIKSNYRSGLGVEGNVDAQAISLLATRPLGVRSVINPMAAVGGADPESRDQARQNVPVGLSALNRLVSVQDYEDFSRGFAGVTKASALLMSSSRPLVFLTIAGADGTAITPTSDLYVNLTAALANLGDPSFPITVASCELLLVIISANVAILSDYVWEDVEPEIRAALLDLLSFENRDLAQDVVASEVIASIQAVEGVNYVDLQTLASVSRNFTAADLSALTTADAAPADRIVSNGPRYGKKGSILPAQLAFLSPNLTDLLILNLIKS